jgi:hypothetical protein
VDLEGERTITRVSFSDAPYRRTRAYAIEALSANGTWQRLGEGTATDLAGAAEVAVDNRKAVKVPVRILQASDTPVIAEIKVFGRQPAARRARWTVACEADGRSARRGVVTMSTDLAEAAGRLRRGSCLALSAAMRRQR